MSTESILKQLEGSDQPFIDFWELSEVKEWTSEVLSRPCDIGFDANHPNCLCVLAVVTPKQEEGK